jgi:predicted GNAT family acetyltransferase
MRDDVRIGQFEIGEGADMVFARYRRTADRLYIDHVEAPPHLRGTGAAGALMQAIVEQAAAEGREIVPVCGYAAAWLKRRERTA